MSDRRLCLKLSSVQAVRADAALSVAQAQHLRQQQEDNSCRDWAEVLQARLMEEQRSRLQLEEELRQQEQKSSSQISTKQVGQRSEVTLFMRGMMMTAARSSDRPSLSLHYSCHFLCVCGV